MKDIAIFGAGGFGREVACLIRLINESENEPKWNLIGFFDDNPDLKGTHNEYGEIIGGTVELNAWEKPLDIAVAIGNGSVVKKIVSKINNPLIEYPNILYKMTYSDKNNFSIGKGNIAIITTFSCAVSIGDFNTMNNSVVFGHDTKVGSYNMFMPATRISGEVNIGDENFFGVGSIVLQQINVGDRVRLGAGSVLMRKPKPDNLYIGNPATIFKY